MFRRRGGEHGFGLVPANARELFPFPALPQVLAPRTILRVPMAELWFLQQLAEHRDMIGAGEQREFVLRLEDDTGVNFDSLPIRVDRFHEDCPMWVQGASDTYPRPALRERVRQALRGG
jgi:hypothetical protein